MPLKKTVLYDAHVALNARMSAYAGFLMPIEYKGLTFEHHAVRQDVGVFDVSHMGQIRVTGPQSLAFLNYVFTNELSDLTIGKTRYGFLCFPSGGVVDDLIIYVLAKNDYLLVVNAANKDQDLTWLIENKGNYDVKITDFSDHIALLAVQGPNAIHLLTKILNTQFDDMASGSFKIMRYESADVLISRTGYTGEDGFEVYGKPSDIKILWTTLLDRGATPCGLGCRDTLRFEASMPLYGHELSKEITPLEAGLTFAVNFDKDFIGKAALLAQKEAGLTRRIVGLELVERGIPREGYPLFIADKEVGYITTGYLSPTTQKPLAFALVDIAHTTIGTPISVEIRGRRVQAVVRDKKFYEKRNKK